MKSTKRILVLLLAIIVLVSFGNFTVLAQTEDSSGDFTAYGLSVKESKQKAIYVLPGYMGSKLYTSDGEQFWIEGRGMNVSLVNGNNVPLVTDIAKNARNRRTSVAMLNPDGSGSKLTTDPAKDKYGSTNTYETIVNKLTNELGSEYAVEFFPYNWLGDLNDSANLLKQDIQKKGYTDIVFVAHSTGGLLASTYISKSTAKKGEAGYVDKAILVATPLFGTYAALAPLETGAGALIGEDYKLVDGFVEAVKTVTNLDIPDWAKDLLRMVTGAYDGGNNWIKDVTHNSPTTYQLLPSEEYLSHFPLEDKTRWFQKDESYTSINDVYNVLNQCDNINSNLTNGNSRSHRTFRQSSVGEDIVSALLEVDTLLIYSSAAVKKTPLTATYETKALGGKALTEIWYDNQGDGTVSWVSASAYMKDKGFQLNTSSYSGIGHTSLISNSAVLQEICNTIKGLSSGVSNDDATPPKGTGTGISDMLKLNYSCDRAVSVSIYDDAQREVARVSPDDFFGFDGSDFIFHSYAAEPGKTDATIYMPNKGYKIVFTAGNTAGVPINFQCEASTLVADGWKDVSVTHSANVTAANGVILTLDETTQAIINRNITSKITGDVEKHYTDWELQDALKMDIKESKAVNIVGSQAAQVKPLLSWNTSDKNIVEVTDGGVLVAKGYGVATISATDGNKSSACQVTVVRNAAKVALKDVGMLVGEMTLIKPKFTPASATETDMTYSMSAKGIIRIDANGVIHALSAGSVTVTGKTSYGVKDKFKVNVFKDLTSKPNTKAVPKSKTAKKGYKIALKAPKGVTLYYTTNGKTPTAKTTTKINPGKTKKLTIRKNTTVRVIAARKGYMPSSPVKRNYRVK
jgi:hypothetical protein